MEKNKKEDHSVNIETFDFEARLKEYEAQGITTQMLEERVRLKREKLLRLMKEDKVEKKDTSSKSDDNES